MARSLRGEFEPLREPFITLPNDEEHVELLRQLDSYLESQLPPESIGLTEEFIKRQAIVYCAGITSELIKNGKVDISALSRSTRERLKPYFNLEAFDSAVDFIDEYTKSKEKLIAELAHISS